MWNYSWYFSPSVLYRFIISPHPPAGPSSVCCNACGGRQSPPAWSHPPSQHPPPPLFFLLSVCTCWSVLAQLSWDLFTCKMRSQCSPAECPSWLRPPRRPRAADPPPSKYIWHTHTFPHILPPISTGYELLIMSATQAVHHRADATASSLRLLKRTHTLAEDAD